MRARQKSYSGTGKAWLVYPKKKKLPRGDHDSQLLEFVANATPFHTKKEMIKLFFVTHRSPKVNSRISTTITPHKEIQKIWQQMRPYGPKNIVNRGTHTPGF